MAVAGIHTCKRSLLTVSRLQPQKTCIGFVYAFLCISLFLCIWPEELEHESPYGVLYSTKTSIEEWYNTSPKFGEFDSETLGSPIFDPPQKATGRTINLLNLLILSEAIGRLVSCSRSFLLLR